MTAGWSEEPWRQLLGGPEQRSGPGVPEDGVPEATAVGLPAHGHPHTHPAGDREPILFQQLVVKESDWKKIAERISTYSPRIIISYTTITINNSTSETGIFSHTLDPTDLTRTGRLRLTLQGNLLGNIAGTKRLRLRVKLGGTTILDLRNVTALGQSAQRRNFKAIIEITNRNAWNSQFVQMVGELSEAGDTVHTFTGTGIWDGSSSGWHPFMVYNTAAIDLSSRKQLVVTAELSAADAAFEFVNSIATLEMAAGEIVGQTTAAFYPNAHPEVTSVDGYVARDVAEETWAALQGGAGVDSSDLNILHDIVITAGTTANRWTQIYRLIMLFDTTAIPSGATIISARLRIFPTTIVQTLGGQSIVIVASTPASNTALVNADFVQLGATALSAAITLASLTVSVYNNIALNAAGLAAITKAGITKLGLRIEADRANAEPTWASGVSADVMIGSADNSFVERRPILEITYLA